MKRIISILNESKKVEETALKMIDKEVDRIIVNKITDISVIESLLDTLLGFMLVDTRSVFDKLNAYYETVNKEYALEYKLIFRDVKDSDK